MLEVIYMDMKFSITHIRTIEACFSHSFKAIHVSQPTLHDITLVRVLKDHVAKYIEGLTEANYQFTHFRDYMQNKIPLQ